MRFTDLNKEQINYLCESSVRTNVEWICLFKHISYKAQIFVLEDKYAYDILNKIYISGAVIRKKDLIDISFDSKKIMYNHISKLIEMKLLKQDGQRDSVIGLTSIGLSLIKKKKIKNSTNISNVTSNILDRAAFLLSVYEAGYKFKVDQFEFITCFTDIIFDDYVKNEEERNKRLLIENYLKKDFATLKSNQIYICDSYEIIIYALNSVDLAIKLDILNKILFFEKTKILFNIKKIILPSKFKKNKNNLEDIKHNEFKSIKVENPLFEFI